MSLIAKNNSSDFPKIPLPEAGTVQAVCCGVWDIGLQKTSFAGTEKIQHKVIIAWEINQKIDAPDSEFHGQPYMMTKKYTVSLGEQANLRKDLESWRGKPFTQEQLDSGFDLEGLYGINCLLGIQHEASKSDASKVYANVTRILPPMKGMERMIPVRANTDPAPKWVQEKAAQAVTQAETDETPAMPEPEFPY